LWSRSPDVPTSRLEKNCQRVGLVSVSAIYVSCPYGTVIYETHTNPISTYMVI